MDTTFHRCDLGRRLNRLSSFMEFCVRGKAVAFHVMGKWGGGRGIAPLILNSGTRRGEWLTARPACFITVPVE